MIEHPCPFCIRAHSLLVQALTPFKPASNELPVDIKVSKQGELYFLARGGGSVEKISYTP